MVSHRNANTAPARSPCIGLALGSGAAKGFAHIGVLRVLEQMGVRPQVIAGTSMGAFVGAAYSAGDLDRLEDWVRLLDNWKVFSLLDINWTLSGGVLGGKKPFRAFFESFEYRNIEDLPLPLTAVATDLHTGQEIWLQEGNLQDAVSASCSIPGLLSAKSLSGRWLVDGAVVNPVPVDVCRAMGATRVIAVDVTEDGAPLSDQQQGQVKTVVSESSGENEESAGDTDPVPEAVGDDGAAIGFGRWLEQGKEQLSQFRHFRNRSRLAAPGMFDTMSQAMDILERRHKRTRMMGSPPDVLIMPKVGDIGGLEFSRAAEAVDAGEVEARRVRTWIEDMIRGG
ncbi:patatin-like phospholipase family protein [Microbulbifer halophilus]|uniref:Patatin-like phospholipase family protein n=1 Tax=Microbulbifer halophilus TaxID=453963 RepID=A0ABW5EBV5_9GAMM|nr:patatin-like phospholipase family protein [Microbulbifer halophilus]MCW8125399.1 patatin-like phospholipase family protein [Microbulbifer halophilus]